MTQQYENVEMAVARVCALVEAIGSFSDGKHQMTVTAGGPELKVRDMLTGNLVAYSSTRADYAQSIEEFAHDYFVMKE